MTGPAVIPEQAAHLQETAVTACGRPRVGRRKEARAMEIVFTILVVTLLIILPVLFFGFVVGGLIYALYKALVGTK